MMNLAAMIKADKTRERILLFMFILLMSGFSLQRFAIFFSKHRNFATIPGIEILKAFLYGFRFDLVITAMLLFPLVMMFIFIPPKYNRKKLVITPKAAYCALITLVMVFSCIADFFFFQEFGKRLNTQIFAYSGYDYIYKTILKQGSLVLAFIIALIIFLTL